MFRFNCNKSWALSFRDILREAAATSPVPTAAMVKTEAETKAPGLAPSPSPARPAVAEGLSEELILVIGAAIAAFVGKRAHIRQIHLIGSVAWPSRAAS